MSERRTMIVEIKNLTEAQAIAIEDMFRAWEQLAGLGASRWTSFYADGDGNFHPQILVNGHKPQYTELLTKEERWVQDDYKIDFDTIAWRLRKP